MAERIEAFIKPELLAWARKSAGLDLTVAAKKIGTKPERLANWESGEQRPTVNQLRKIGQVYKRPIAIFYLSTPPKGFDAIKDFRLLSDKQGQSYSPSLLFEIRRAYNRRESAIELSSELEDAAPSSIPLVRMGDESENVASMVRQFLGITAEIQASWKSDRESFNGWRAAIEGKNILVFQASRIPVDEMRGFSISKAPFPVVVINVQDALVARTFTLLHELTHILLGEEGVCDLSGKAEIEVFCNAVAGAALVPKNSLLSEPEVRHHSGSTWNDTEITNIASRYNVSREVVLRRLLTLGKVSSAFYKAKSNQYREERIRIAANPKDRKAGGPSPDRKAVSSLGKLFSRLVLNSYHQEKITASDVSDLLAIKLNYLPKIETAIFG